MSDIELTSSDFSHADAVAARRERDDAVGTVAMLELRIEELKAMVREMILAVPSGSVCDPQNVADALRAIAERHGISVDG
jgi:hypothetical protein